MSPHYTSKSRGRLRYYVSQALLQARTADAGSLPRVAAKKIEGLVLDTLARVCRKSLVSKLTQSASTRRTLLVETVSEITVGKRQIKLSLKPDTDVLDASACDPSGVKVLSIGNKTTLAIDLKGLDRSAGALIIAPERIAKDETLLKMALARVWRWRSLLETSASDSILAIAKKEGANESYIKKVLPLAFLPPTRNEHILSGGQLTKVGKYRSWDEREISWISN